MMNLTAFGQPSSTDSVLISREQQKQCVKWYYQNQFKDSIIIVKDSIILNQAEFIESCDERVQLFNEKLSEEQNRSTRYKKQRNRSLFGGSVLVVLAFFTGILIK